MFLTTRGLATLGQIREAIRDDDKIATSVVHMPEIKKPVGPGGSREKACRVRAISGSG